MERTDDKPLTERSVQRRIIVERYRRNFVIPNFTPPDWWECDVFEITDAGYFQEYEIKLTAADFKADAHKVKTDWKETSKLFNSVTPRGPMFEPITKNKHALIGQPPGPNRFYYVAPKGVIQEVPPWAGHFEIWQYPGRTDIWNTRLILRKKAPLLHKEKISPKTQEYARTTCYWRFHNLFLK